MWNYKQMIDLNGFFQRATHFGNALSNLGLYQLEKWYKLRKNGYSYHNAYQINKKENLIKRKL